jgi:hypothetical protein
MAPEVVKLHAPSRTTSAKTMSSIVEGEQGARLSLAMIILEISVIPYIWHSKAERGEAPDFQRLPIYYEPNRTTTQAKLGEREEDEGRGLSPAMIILDSFPLS